MAVLLIISGLLAGLFICIALLGWNEVRYGKKGLPPGSMGWPVFGETTEFLRQGPQFMKSKSARYGNLFKSHILGCPTVVSMDPEINRFILLNEGKGLVPGYPQSMIDVLGEGNLASVTGLLHKAIRGTILSLITPTIIRDQILPTIDAFMRTYTSDWNGKIIDIQEKTKEMALLSSLKQIAGLESGPFSETFKMEFYKQVLGSFSLPIHLPGTNYSRALQAREKILKMLKEIIEERRACGSTKADMLHYMLTVEEVSRFKPSIDQIIDLIITIIYSGYETVSTTCMMAVKYLHDYPDVLGELRREHLNLRKGTDPKNAVDWNDYKAMEFTRAVILETMRLATVVHGVLRKTTDDMQIKGYYIPKGWKIYVYFREFNYDPFLYPDPFTFNPWRWQDKKLEFHPNFMLFGGGSRLCPGKELGILEISTFLHYFVTKYRWEETGGDKILQFPRIQAPKGLHIRVTSY